MNLTGCASSSQRKGLLLAALILLGWLISLITLLQLDLGGSDWLQAWPQRSAGLLAAVLLRTFLHTGLFIVGHDAMHGVLAPGAERFNDRLGGLALGLYAALPYGPCRRKHRCHHAATASAGDPDFHADPRAGFWGWYRRFMAGYLTPSQMGRLLGGWALLALLACRLSPTGPANVLLFCTLPLLLSSLQLFGFGTYLPHRAQRPPLSQTTPSSLALPPWLSLLACFHFGYHHEHHRNPSLAWFELPTERQGRPSLAPA